MPLKGTKCFASSTISSVGAAVAVGYASPVLMPMHNSKSGNVWLYIFDDNEIISEPVEQIPQWIKMNAEWWSKGIITDSDFLQGIEYLIQNEIMKIEATEVNSSSSGEIPFWIRNNAEWWSAGLISDNEFLSGIKYLIEAGIIAYQ